MKQSILILIIAVQTLFGGLLHAGAVKNSKPEHYSIPAVPAMLSTPEQQAKFVMTHFWDNFDFNDLTLIAHAEYTEQAFVDFVNLLPNVSATLASLGVNVLMNHAAANKAMYAHFMGLADKYLYDPNSPLRNEECYIYVLQNIVSNSKLSKVEKIRPQFQLQLALKNRKGHTATDFVYTTSNGGKARLFDTKANRILLIFHHPDCPACIEVQKYIKAKGIEKLVKIVLVQPDVDKYLEKIYDLRASPTLYLLDANKKVLLKDALIKEIETYLKS